jgi:hypothetical protein
MEPIEFPGYLTARCVGAATLAISILSGYSQRTFYTEHIMGASLENDDKIEGEEVYTVRILRCPETGVPRMVQWLNESGMLHRIDGPAFIHRRNDGGTVEGWYRDGKPIDAPVRSPGTPRRRRNVTRLTPNGTT